MIASAAATWAIVIVAVVCLSFWLVAVLVFATRPRRAKNANEPKMPGPVLGGMHFAEGGRSVAPDRDSPAVFTDQEIREIADADDERATRRPYVPVQGVPARSGGADQPSEAPSLPGQRAAGHDEAVKDRPRGDADSG